MAPAISHANSILFLSQKNKNIDVLLPDALKSPLLRSMLDRSFQPTSAFTMRSFEVAEGLMQLFASLFPVGLQRGTEVRRSQALRLRSSHSSTADNPQRWSQRHRPPWQRHHRFLC